MRSALLCVIFTLLVRGGTLLESEQFRPTPIPLDEWRYERRQAREKPPPTTARYWEDALRHSVYLTLVRDKIDQLIAHGDVISPDTKPDRVVSTDVDDHDLWEKVKTASFDRLRADEPAPTGDVTVVSKGRLVDGSGSFRFVEDERTKDKCEDDKCLEGVKAFWSVKRVKQRDVNSPSGKYHYELTFSVVSQQPKKLRKPYENPARTFTVRESAPDQVLDMPQEHRPYERVPIVHHSGPRPGRQIWFHKNIAPPAAHHTGRQHIHGLDRLFSSLFSDEEDDYAPPRYRPPPPPHAHPPYPQYSKMGYVSSPTDQQKRLTPYPYKPHMHKYSRPIPPPPFSHTQHHYVESDTVGHSYATPPDYRYGPPTKPGKTTRPPVLPTPLPPITPAKNWTAETDVKQNVTETTTKTPELIPINKPYSKHRPGPMKVNYLPEHVRPPIYNAPPGVFVTMDKKPFKPMPPLKIITKPYKYNKPVDFRPSPQVLDMQQFSEPDPFRETAFRPMTWNLHDNTTTERIEVAETSSPHNVTRKNNYKGKKPPKKHEINKTTRITTTAPEIITASNDSDEESDAMQWANVVSAFGKTTPMASQTEKSEVLETTTPSSTTSSTSTTTVPTTTARRRTTTTEPPETTTTRKPKPKRTRPPPKFTKPDRPKKHKRITTSTTKAPEVKVTQDLTPQASSAAATKPFDSVNKTQSTTTSTTTTTTTTTTTPKPTTTTTRHTTTTTTNTTPASTAQPKPTSSTTQPKIKNRFRQSTLLQKGTSVKHDKWSTPSLTPPEKSKQTVTVHQEKHPPRRKGSNFHGYTSSTTPKIDDKYEKFHEDQGMKNLNVKPLTTTTQSYDETGDQYESNSESSDYANSEDEDGYEDAENEEGESKDHSEYIFQPSTTPSEKTNEVDHDPITTEQIVTSPLPAPKNKTKCKKRKTQNSTITEEVLESNTEQVSSTSTTTIEASTPSIFEELFGSFTVDDSTTEKPVPSTSTSDLQEEGSQKIGQFVKLDDDLQDFLDSLEKNGRNVNIEDYEDDEDGPEIDDDESEDASARESRDTSTFDDYHDRPYSLLELMAME